MAETTENRKMWNPLEDKEKKPPRQKEGGHRIARYNRQSTTGTTGIERELATDGSIPIVVDPAGNVIPNSTQQSLGTPISPWKGAEFQKLVSSGAFDSGQTFDDPVQIGGFWYPGKKSGTALPPSVAPAASQNAAGGSIAAGTYYFKVTYFNRNGETTASPVSSSLTTTGTTSRVYVAPNDFAFATGTYGYLTYASNDAVNFFLQTPSGVVTDFELTNANAGAPTGKTGHYVKLGSNGARFNSLTFSGTTPPTTNTATIDAVQVALNATRRATDYTPQGTLVLPPIDGAGNLYQGTTTPIIKLKGDRIIGSGAQNGSVNFQTRLSNLTNWGLTRVATVMCFGGDANIANIGIQGQNTNALMILGGAGYQAGNGYGMSVSDVMLRVPTNATYNPLVMVGVLYHTFWRNVSMLGGGAVVEWRNAAGQNHVFRDGRWDTSGPSYMRSVPGWTDPDNGAHDGAFPFGVANIMLDSVLFENGTGITWDCVGLGMEFRNIQNSDAAIAVGTDSLAKFGTNATFGGSSGITLCNTSFGTSGNARVGTNVVGGGSALIAYGNSSFGVGSSTGSQQTIDFNNIGLSVAIFGQNVGSFDSSAAAATPHAINVADTSRIFAFGAAGGSPDTNVNEWAEIPGGITFTNKNGNNYDRSTTNRWRLLNPAGGGQAQFRRGNDDAAVLTLLTGTNENQISTLRNNFRIGGSATNPLLVIGASGATPGAAEMNGLGLANGYYIASRNTANNANILMWRVNTSDELESQAPLGIMPLANGQPFGKSGKAFAPGVTRIKTFGTALVAGDFVLSAGWGAGSTVTAVTGTDMAWNITITAAGVPSANPTVTLTFKDGSWTNVPICVSKWNGGTGAAAFVQDAPTATTDVITFLALPVAALTYILSGVTIGR